MNTWPGPFGEYLNDVRLNNQGKLFFSWSKGSPGDCLVGGLMSANENDGSYINMPIGNCSYQVSSLDANNLSDKCFALFSSPLPQIAQCTAYAGATVYYTFPVPVTDTALPQRMLRIKDSQFLFAGLNFKANFFRFYKYDYLSHNFTVTSTSFLNKKFVDFRYGAGGYIYILYQSTTQVKMGIMKLNPNTLSMIWDLPISHNGFADIPLKLAVNSTGQIIYAVGHTMDSTNLSLRKIHFLKITPSGIVTNNVILQDPQGGSSYVQEVLVDPTSCPILIGSVLNGGIYKSLIVKLKKTGVVLWRKNGTSNTSWSGAVLDSLGNVYTVGSTIDNLYLTNRVMARKFLNSNGSTSTFLYAPTTTDYQPQYPTGIINSGNNSIVFGINWYDGDFPFGMYVHYNIVFKYSFNSFIREEEAETNPEMDFDSISIYPNPAANEIKISNLSPSENQIKIFNLLGQQVKSIDVSNEQNTTINIADLTNGIYEMTISDGKKIICKKFVKE